MFSSIEEFKRFAVIDSIMSEADIVRRNLKMMFSRGDCSMQKLLMKTSIGRKTVVVDGKKYPITGAHFYYDAETGEILCFSGTDKRWEGKAADGHFEIAVDIQHKKNSFFRITTVNFDDRASKAANRAIFQTMQSYNAACKSEESLAA